MPFLHTIRVSFWLLVLVLPGCRRVQPDAPTTQPFDPPIAQATSYVVGQVTFNIRDLERKVNLSLKPVLVSDEMFRGKKGEAWHLRVERMGAVRIRYARGRVSFAAPLRVFISNPIGLRRVKRSRSLGALFVQFDSPVAVAPNWRLVTQARFVTYHWLEKPKLRILGIKIPITKLADNILTKRRADIETALDGAVYHGLRLDREVERIWRDLQKPLRINRVPDEVWIRPRPTSVAAAAVRGNAQTLTVPLQIGFRADTHIGPRPDDRPTTPLPRLQRCDSLPPTSNLRVVAFIPYADLNRMLARRLNEQQLTLAGGSVQLKNATVYGGGQSLILKTAISGAVNGTLYFRGQPRYDTLSDALRIYNVDFDVDTKETLLSTADWLLHDHLRDTLRNAVYLPLRDQLTQLPEKIETAFARSKAGRKTALSVQTFRLVPQRIVIRPDGIQVLINVQSKVAVRVNRL